MAQTNDSFAGTWHSCYWYPSNDKPGEEEKSEYEVIVHQKGGQLILESKPNELGAYIFIRLSVDGKLATGTWHETTSPRGAFKGMVYSGALQLIISDDQNRMDGKWVGVGFDYDKKGPDIYTGRWELVRLQ